MNAFIICKEYTMELRERYNLKSLILYSDGKIYIDGLISVKDLSILVVKIEEHVAFNEGV